MYARLVNELLGTKIKVINGYKGQPDEFQAIERGELDGLFMSGWSGPGRAYVRERRSRAASCGCSSRCRARAILNTTTRRR